MTPVPIQPTRVFPGAIVKLLIVTVFQFFQKFLSSENSVAAAADLPSLSRMVMTQPATRYDARSDDITEPILKRAAGNSSKLIHVVAGATRCCCSAEERPDVNLNRNGFSGPA
jgi:hypothetical protein